LLTSFQESRLFIKVHSCHKHKCCPTSDLSLPDMRISPIRGVVREREYYCWELWYESIRFTCVCPIARDPILRSLFGFFSHCNLQYVASHLTVSWNIVYRQDNVYPGHIRFSFGRSGVFLVFTRIFYGLCSDCSPDHCPNLIFLFPPGHSFSVPVVYDIDRWVSTVIHAFFLTVSPVLPNFANHLLCSRCCFFHGFYDIRSVNPGVLQGSPMTFSGFRSDNHHIYHTTSHCSIPPNVSLLWTIPSGYYSAEAILPIHHRISLDMITQPVRTCLHISSILKPTTFVSELLDGRISFP
jgi:hypothetical protein